MTRSLQELLDYPGEDIQETFCLNFTVRTPVFMTVSVLYSGGKSWLTLDFQQNNKARDFQSAYLEFSKWVAGRNLFIGALRRTARTWVFFVFDISTAHATLLDSTTTYTA